MPGEEGEVRISLVADDKASAEADKVADHTRAAGDAAGWLKEHWAAVAATAALVTVSIAGAYEFSSKFTESALEAADAAVQQERAMTGLLGMLDQGKHSMGQVADFAHEMREEIEMAGVKSGTSAASMNEAFNAIIERGGMSAKHAEELTEKMALVGKTSRGGLEGLSSGFQMMELGMTRARNPIVQLIASTQTLHGNAQSVAHQLEQMSQGRRVEIAEKAIAARANVLQQNGVGSSLQTLDEARQSFSGFREMLFDAMGGPIHNELLPILNELQTWLISHADELKDYAQGIGAYLAHFVDYGKAVVQGVYDGIKSSWEDLQKVADDWRDVMGTTQMTSEQVREDFKAAAHYMIEAVKLVADSIDQMKIAYQYVADAANNRQLGSTQANEAGKKLEGMADDYGPEGQKKFDEAAQAYRKLAEEAGFSATKINMTIERLAAHEQGVQGSGEHMREEVASGNWYKFGGELDAAVKYQNDAAAVFQAKLILSSEQARQGLVTGGLHITEGLDAFVKLVAAGSPETAEKLKKLMETGNKAPIEDLGGKGSAYYDFRGSHFQQDFKDVDPDRIALVFNRDLSRAAAARTQSRNGMAFGL